jgi:pimeloyl-ACP methyl ester carboxylesterase
MLHRVRTILGDPGDGVACEWDHTVRQKRATAHDGTGIYYEVVGEGERTIVLANGLGGRRYAWEDLIGALWRDYRLISWDYRGLFSSDVPEQRRRLAVVHHADDIECILRAEGVQRAAFIGWSMGVQVSLEFAGQHRDEVAGLVLLNGTYGHALSTGFQPWFGIPFLPKRIHGFLEWLQGHPDFADSLASFARIAELPTAVLFSVTAGPMVLRHRRLLHQYFDDVLGPSFRNYLRLFQELDAHSAYHLLPEITAPALIVSGALDTLTPARQSREMARRMPNAEYVALRRASHFALMERPIEVVPRIRSFLETRARF